MSEVTGLALLLPWPDMRLMPIVRTGGTGAVFSQPRSRPGAMGVWWQPLSWGDVALSAATASQ